jgi:hypothetical protein
MPALASAILPLELPLKMIMSKGWPCSTRTGIDREQAALLVGAARMPGARHPLSRRTAAAVIDLVIRGLQDCGEPRPALAKTYS